MPILSRCGGCTALSLQSLNEDADVELDTRSLSYKQSGLGITKLVRGGGTSAGSLSRTISARKPTPSDCRDDEDCATQAPSNNAKMGTEREQSPRVISLVEVQAPRVVSLVEKSLGRLGLVSSDIFYDEDYYDCDTVLTYSFSDDSASTCAEESGDENILSHAIEVELAEDLYEAVLAKTLDDAAAKKAEKQLTPSKDERRSVPRKKDGKKKKKKTFFLKKMRRRRSDHSSRSSAVSEKQLTGEKEFVRPPPKAPHEEQTLARETENASSADAENMEKREEKEQETILCLIDPQEEAVEDAVAEFPPLIAAAPSTTFVATAVIASETIEEGNRPTGLSLTNEEIEIAILPHTEETAGKVCPLFSAPLSNTLVAITAVIAPEGEIELHFGSSSKFVDRTAAENTEEQLAPAFVAKGKDTPQNSVDETNKESCVKLESATEATMICAIAGGSSTIPKEKYADVDSPTNVGKEQATKASSEVEAVDESKEMELNFGSLTKFVDRTAAENTGEQLAPVFVTKGKDTPQNAADATNKETGVQLQSAAEDTMIRAIAEGSATIPKEKYADDDSPTNIDKEQASRASSELEAVDENEEIEVHFRSLTKFVDSTDAKNTGEQMAQAFVTKGNTTKNAADDTNNETGEQLQSAAEETMIRAIADGSAMAPKEKCPDVDAAADWASNEVEAANKEYPHTDMDSIATKSKEECLNVDTATSDDTDTKITSSGDTVKELSSCTRTELCPTATKNEASNAQLSKETNVSQVDASLHEGDEDANGFFLPSLMSMYNRIVGSAAEKELRSIQMLEQTLMESEQSHQAADKEARLIDDARIAEKMYAKIAQLDDKTKILEEKVVEFNAAREATAEDAAKLVKEIHLTFEEQHLAEKVTSSKDASKEKSPRITEICPTATKNGASKVRSSTETKVADKETKAKESLNEGDAAANDVFSLVTVSIGNFANAAGGYLAERELRTMHMMEQTLMQSEKSYQAASKEANIIEYARLAEQMHSKIAQVADEKKRLEEKVAEFNAAREATIEGGQLVKEMNQIEKKRISEETKRRKVEVGAKAAAEEEARLAEEAQLVEEVRIAEEERIAEEKRIAEDAKRRFFRAAAKAAAKDKARLAARLADEARRAKEEKRRIKEEKRRADEIAAAKAAEEEARLAEKVRLRKERRLAKKMLLVKETKRREEEARLAEQALLAEERRIAEEKYLADEIAAAKAAEEEARLAEEARLRKEKRLAKMMLLVKETKRREKEVTLAEELRKRIAEEKVLADEIAAAKAEEKRLAKKRQLVQEAKRREEVVNFAKEALLAAEKLLAEEKGTNKASSEVLEGVGKWSGATAHTCNMDSFARQRRPSEEKGGHKTSPYAADILKSLMESEKKHEAEFRNVD